MHARHHGTAVARRGAARIDGHDDSAMPGAGDARMNTVGSCANA